MTEVDKHERVAHIWSKFVILLGLVALIVILSLRL